MKLPIHDFQELIVDSVIESQVTIVVGETGSGKTTQIPQFLYHAGFSENGVIGVTEPRRIAAVSTSKFVAGELQVFLGGEVGYQVRFDDASTEGTHVKFMTDGILLREFQLDPDLTKYSVIMVDEAHERSRNIDFVLGLLKDLLARRKDLRLVVASATIDEKKFSEYFWNAPIINVSGRMFPVETVWSDVYVHEKDAVDAVIQKVADIHGSGKDGDILVFMTGQNDINGVIDGLKRLNLSGLVTIPVYAALPTEEQQKIFDRCDGMRRVVVATNIAETSITIDGVVFVVDSGLIKQSNFHPESGIQSLDVVPHSQAGCEQRRGRAGRTRSGVCLRMYTEENFRSRPKFTEPEIRRTSLASIVLAMEDIGIENIRQFDFIDPPEKEAFTEAYETLLALGAIRRGKSGLTEIGKAMADLPLEPRIARMLLEAAKYGCVRNVATVAAFLSVRNIFFRPKDKELEADRAHAIFKNQESDALTFIKIWKGYRDSGFSHDWCVRNFLNAKAIWEVSQIRDQLLQILSDRNFDISENGNAEATSKAVAVGLAYNLFEHSTRQWFSGVLRPVSGVSIHPGSAAFGNRMRWMVAAELMRTNRAWARGCVVVKPEWLPDIAPDFCVFGEPVLESYDLKEEAVYIKKPILYRGQHVGDARSKIGVAEAARIQNARIEDAEAKGLIPLTFFEERGSGSDYFRSDWFAERDGIRYKCSFFSGREGETYYCRTKEFMGNRYATPVFRILDLPVTQEKAPQEVGRQPIALDKLAKRWGARLKS